MGDSVARKIAIIYTLLYFLNVKTTSYITQAKKELINLKIKV